MDDQRKSNGANPKFDEEELEESFENNLSKIIDDFEKQYGIKPRLFSWMSIEWVFNQFCGNNGYFQSKNSKSFILDINGFGFMVLFNQIQEKIIIIYLDI